MLRNGLAAVAVLIPSPSAQASLIGTVVVSPKAISTVTCFSKKGVWMGTAFRIGPQGLTLSVNHVTSSGRCFISGKEIEIAYKSPVADFSELNGRPGPWLPIDCGGFVKDRKYLAVGHARGLDELTTVELTGTDTIDKDGQARLEGVFSVIPGQSGGPVIDAETGRVVGTINMEDFEEGLSWSVPLKGTPVCRSSSS
jgi:hypothetical protein